MRIATGPHFVFESIRIFDGLLILVLRIRFNLLFELTSVPYVFFLKKSVRKESITGTLNILGPFLGHFLHIKFLRFSFKESLSFSAEMNLPFTLTISH